MKISPRREGCFMGCGRAAAVALAVCGSFAGSALAEPLVDNLAQPTRDVTLIAAVEPEVNWAAQGFGTHARAVLNSVTLLAGLSVDGPDVIAEVRAGEDPATGSVVATLIVPPMSEIDVQPADFVPDALVTLEPGTTYWIVVGVPTTGSFGWAYAEGNQFDGPGYFASYWYSYDAGATWADYGGDNPYQMNVDVTFVVCSADLNEDGIVDFADYLEFLNLYDAQDPRVDFNQDGIIDFADYLEFLNLFDAGC